MSSYTHSKEDLKKLTVLNLKLLLREMDGTKSKFAAKRKPELIEMIWEKWGGDEGWAKHKESESKSAKPFDMQSKNDDSPNDEYDSDTPKQRPPPKKKTKSIPLETVEFNYNEEKDIMNIKIELAKYTPGAPEPPDADDISPEELIELINKDEFCIKTANSLKDIYKAKLEKYQKLLKKTLQSITNDTAEKNEMLLTSGIEKQELDRLFPMITINTAFLIKLKALSRLAITKGREYDGTNTRRVIEMVRKNLLEAITDKEDGIVSVTGMSREKIRNQLCKTLYILSKGYRPFMDAFLNLVFTGPAGVGKTKLAKTYSFVFKKAGILLQGDLIIASPKDMVGEYIGHTAIKSAGVLMKGLEGVILIDEAYQIMPCNNGVLEKDSKSFGPEAITEIVNFLDKYMGMSIMIVAGYEREMENCFFAANEGLNRRFPNRISIPSYSNNDLLSIFINGVNTKIGEDIFTEEIIRYIFTIIVKLSQTDTKIFSNQAGDMVNLSSMFINSYYGSVKINWREDYASDIRIVNSTFNQFLRNKGYLAVFSP
jgi:flagellar biosynthesis GTPase FlhF